MPVGGLAVDPPSTAMTRIRVVPNKAVDGITMDVDNKVPATAKDVYGDRYTISPASVNNPF